MLSEEEIAYIREWAASGNGWRPTWESVPKLNYDVLEMIISRTGTPEEYGRLNKTGLTIATQAEEIERLKAALEQACETAEDIYTYSNARESGQFESEMTTISLSRAELLGNG